MTDLKLTVIGCSAASPRPGGACSSYLVTYGALNVLMDCGPGSLSVLRQEINPRNLDAIVISHLHADHTLDLVPLAYGLKYGPPAGDERAPAGSKLALFVPPGGKEFPRVLRRRSKELGATATSGLPSTSWSTTRMAHSSSAAMGERIGTRLPQLPLRANQALHPLLGN